MIQRVSPAGKAVSQLEVGDIIVVDGVSYKIHDMENGIPNDEAAWDELMKIDADITIQTSDNTEGPTGIYDLTFWWANEIKK